MGLAAVGEAAGQELLVPVGVVAADVESAVAVGLGVACGRAVVDGGVGAAGMGVVWAGHRFFFLRAARLVARLARGWGSSSATTCSPVDRSSVSQPVLGRPGCSPRGLLLGVAMALLRCVLCGVAARAGSGRPWGSGVGVAALVRAAGHGLDVVQPVDLLVVDALPGDECVVAGLGDDHGVGGLLVEGGAEVVEDSGGLARAVEGVAFPAGEGALRAGDGGLGPLGLLGAVVQGVEGVGREVVEGGAVGHGVGSSVGVSLIRTGGPSGGGGGSLRCCQACQPRTGGGSSQLMFSADSTDRKSTR